MNKALDLLNTNLEVKVGECKEFDKAKFRDFTDGEAAS